jgi:hypothetical protein
MVFGLSGLQPETDALALAIAGTLLTRRLPEIWAKLPTKSDFSTSFLALFHSFASPRLQKPVFLHPLASK